MMSESIMFGLVGVVIGGMPEWKHIYFSMCFVHVRIPGKEADKGVQVTVVYTRLIPQEMLWMVSILEHTQ